MANKPPKNLYFDRFENWRENAPDDDGPTNETERKLWEKITADGGKVLRKGWPDFCVIDKDDKLCCVEVKRDDCTEPEYHQAFMLYWLAKQGIPCYVWTPGAGLTPVMVRTIDAVEGPDCETCKHSYENRARKLRKKGKKDGIGKVCCRCHKAKPISAYDTSFHKADGLEGWCKKCKKAHIRRWCNSRKAQPQISHA